MPQPDGCGSLTYTGRRAGAARGFPLPGRLCGGEHPARISSWILRSSQRIRAALRRWKHPALVVSIGHWSDGKTIRENQIFCANLARNGILAAAYDPLFQGERCPYDREALAELFGGLPEDMLSVSMHMQAGNLAYLLGRNVAALFAHDSVAVLDYLCTRPDVDTGRIGCTGQSGGGTQSLYLSALDDRIRYCSPIQCVSRQHLINPTGIGDCEQSLLSISAQEGFDQADLLWSSFPKPLFLNGALYDSFPIVGARETAAELAELYDVMGLRERFTARFASCAHEISAETRRFAYEWFVRECWSERRCRRWRRLCWTLSCAVLSGGIAAGRRPSTLRC